MPSDQVIEQRISLIFYSLKSYLDIYGYRIKYSKKVLPVKRSSISCGCYLRIDLEGQKNYEEFYDRNIRSSYIRSMMGRP